MSHAHFYTIGKAKHLILSEGPQPTGKTIKVASKSEARKLAREHGAKPYNF
ncbi:MAG: hypothetical protein ACPH3N_00870 [Alcanivorax sediminis]|uniref:hypothetical protein n=1 Tax=Alcanivorax sediminis TaxID=2663008 RepID=UPI003C5BC433